MRRFPIFGLVFLAAATSAAAQDDAEIAKQLANPVSSLISVPFQHNFDCCFGPEDAFRYTMNFQPVIPFALTPDWTVVVRTIVPTVFQEAPVRFLDDEFGLSDTTQSFFFVPRLSGGYTLGFGPVFLWPTATEDTLGTEKWGAGPTVVALKQTGGLTFGALTNHIWSYADAGDEDRGEVSQTFLQPFISYTFPDTTNISLNTEATYDWIGEDWTVPINAGVSHVYKFGPQRVSLGLTGRYYAVAPEGGPEWGVRFITTFLFPKK